MVDIEALLKTSLWVLNYKKCTVRDDKVYKNDQLVTLPERQVYIEPCPGKPNMARCIMGNI